LLLTKPYGDLKMADQQKITRDELEAKLVAHAWQDEAFKQELISNPKVAIERELGQKLPESTNIKVLEETGNTIYFVLPSKPSVEELSDEQLESVAGGIKLPFGLSEITVGVETGEGDQTVGGCG
jgi:hypothetical protein